jgi:hypothetical protein
MAKCHTAIDGQFGEQMITNVKEVARYVQQLTVDIP